MSGSEQKLDKDTKNKTASEVIGKIEPVKKSSNDVVELADIVSEEAKIDESSQEKTRNAEKALLAITRLFLREYGIRKSGAAIRDAVEMPHDNYTPQHAVSALSSLGFKASFGNINLKKLTSDFFPIIAFLKDGSPVLLKSLNSQEEFVCLTSEKKPNKLHFLIVN